MKTLDVVVPIKSRGRRVEASPALLATPRIPRITRLMALAIRFEQMLQKAEVRDYAELARLGHVTRARLTQIMNLTLLAPDLQQALLENVDHDVPERDIRRVLTHVDWATQRAAFWQTSRVASRTALRFSPRGQRVVADVLCSSARALS